MKRLLCYITLIIILFIVLLYKNRIEYFKVSDPVEYKNKVRDILENTLLILYKNKYKPIVFYGTLLGIIRDKDIIDNDYDSDILLSYDEFKRLKTDTKTIKEINKLYKIHKYNLRWSLKLKESKDSFYHSPHLDIFQYYKKDKCSYVISYGNNIDIKTNYNKTNYNFNSSYTDNIIKIDAPKQFKKIKYFYIPKNYNQLLTELYGNYKIKSKKHARRKIC